MASKSISLLSKIIIIIAVFLIGISFGKSNVAVAPESEVPAAEIQESVSLMLDYGNGRIDTYENLEWIEESMAEMILRIAGEEGFPVKSKDFGGDLGIMIEEIDGMGNDFSNGKYWQYWINNSYSELGASSYQVKPGDVIMWKLTAGQLEE